MHEGTAAVRAAMLEASGLEERGHRRLAVGTGHGLRILQNVEAAAFAGGADLLRAFHPHGFAFVTGDSAGSIGGGRLAGCHETGKSEDASEEQCFGQCFHMM